jgi:hypothetical protein
MFDRSTQTCLARRLFVMLAAIGLALGSAYGPAPLAAPGEPADTPPRLEVVLRNGGGQPAINFGAQGVGSGVELTARSVRF